MTSWFVYPLALVVGVLFNVNPSCGCGTLVWASTQTKPGKAATLALVRIGVLALVGAIAGFLGTAARAPWGILLLGTAAYLLYTTIRQSRLGQAGACILPRGSTALPWVLALIPPPSGYIGLAIFYGGFRAPSPLEGAFTLTLVGFGLTLPVWVLALKPAWWTSLRMRWMGNSKVLRVQIVFQYLGVAVLTAVGLAFVFVHGFHRPLLELIH